MAATNESTDAEGGCRGSTHVANNSGSDDPANSYTLQLEQSLKQKGLSDISSTQCTRPRESDCIC